MTFENQEYIKGFLGRIGFKEAETESMMNTLHAEEWWSHNCNSDENYEDTY